MALPVITITDSDAHVEIPQISHLAVCPKVRFKDDHLQKCEGESLKVKTDGLDSEFGYIFTLMYGRYTKDLGDFAKSEASRVKKLEKLKRKENKIIHGFQRYKGGRCAKCSNLAVCWRFTFARLGEDWIYLAVLGILMALLSFIMDYAISMCLKARIWLYQDLVKHHGLQFLSWTMFPVLLIIFSSGFVHVVAPQAIGSGIPEMKTILRGVVLKEYLTFRTLVSKMIGLTTSLGSGMPIGKEGPFVHIASIVATLLSKLVTSFKGIYENESRNSEMLAAACAVGVACSFAAPIGGVLFSIEVTSVYFAVRNYWRGFFAAVCGAMVFRLLAVWFKDEETLTALFKTSFRIDFPFDPQELVAFAMIGIFCGFAGSLFVWCHRQVVNFNRRHKRLNYFLQKNRFIYPALVSFVVSSLTFPHGLGQFIAAELDTHTAMNELFSNITWTGEHPETDEAIIISHWRTSTSNIYVNLVIFIIMNVSLISKIYCKSKFLSHDLISLTEAFIPGCETLVQMRNDGVTKMYRYKSVKSFDKEYLVSCLYLVFSFQTFKTCSCKHRFCKIFFGNVIFYPYFYFWIFFYHTYILRNTAFVLTIISMTLPVPAGVFIPVFKIGAAFGRLVGECMAAWFPDGIRVGGEVTKILPGGYAVVGAAALSGSVTHTISTSVIVFELTGQIAHIIPVMIAVLISNAIAQSLQPSIYDSIILIKRLPYLPDIVSTSTGAYNTYVEDIMIREVYFIYHGATYKELKKLLKTARYLSSFPLVDSPDSMILLGSIQRVELLHLLETHIGKERRLKIAARRAEEATENITSDIEDVMDEVTAAAPKKSRFAVTKVPDTSIRTINEMQPSSSTPLGNVTPSHTPTTPATPKKSILKKTGYAPSPMTSPYSTVTSQDSRLRLAFENIFRKANTLRDVDDTIQSTVQSVTSLKRVTLPRERVIDMSHEEQLAWEFEELEAQIDFTDCHVDPAPFQLVERTSLLKVHSLFSMLGLNRAYVTAIGRLVGVVALKENNCTDLEGSNVSMSGPSMTILMRESRVFGVRELLQSLLIIFICENPRSQHAVRKAIEGAHGTDTTDAKVNSPMNHSASTDSFQNGSTLTTFAELRTPTKVDINLDHSIQQIDSDEMSDDDISRL
ncbi:Chloride channel protein 2 [Nymphon striatum]|nr:Chloride channel protein 2 [Nymphon striatum]